MTWMIFTHLLAAWSGCAVGILVIALCQAARRDEERP